MFGLGFALPPAEVLASVGAFLAGLGSLLGGIAAIRLAKAKGAKESENR